MGIHGYDEANELSSPSSNAGDILRMFVEKKYLVAFYDKLSATAGLFFSLTPGTRTGHNDQLNNIVPEKGLSF